MCTWKKWQRPALGLIVFALVVLLLVAFPSALQGRAAPDTHPRSVPPPGAEVSTAAFCDSVTQIPKTECQALVDLYYATNGASWTNKTDWLVTITPCSWHGVTCSGSPSVVVWLELPQNNLSGAIPYGLGNLTHLTRLVLWRNQLTGAIPTSLGNLSNLVVLDLDTNQLTGSIPAVLGDLSKLRMLLLWGNQLTGNIPTTLGDLSNLTHLVLNQNQLTGSIPAALGDLSNLEWLVLGLNQLTGNIPSSLGNLSGLERLYLHSNQLTGSIPASLGNLSSLGILRVDNNPLTGPLPQTFTNLALTLFYFNNTNLCEPPDEPFQAWLASISDLLRTGILCSTTTATPTVTRTSQPPATGTATSTSTGTPQHPATGTATRTPTRTPTRTLTPPSGVDCPDILINGGFEDGLVPHWVSAGAVWIDAGRGSPSGAWMGGAGATGAELAQQVLIPAGCTPVSLRYWINVRGSQDRPGDRLLVVVQHNGTATELRAQPATAPFDVWEEDTLDLTAYAGSTIAVTFVLHKEPGSDTVFALDDVSLTACSAAGGLRRLYLPVVMKDYHTYAPTSTATPTRTATVAAGTSTPTRTRTVTPTGTPSGTTLIFSDNFNDGDLGGWTAYNGTWTNPGTYMRGEYATGGDWCMRAESGGNFTYEGTVNLLSGNAVGLVFRSSADGTSSYDAILDAVDGVFKLSKRSPYTVLASYSMTVERSHQYKIKVVANGSTIEAYLDDVKRLTVTDTTYTSGHFGVMLYRATAAYDTLKAWATP
jgi:Leucine-rich repeat (LRR) protein